MRPYDWCDPRCPNPCTCQDTIEREYSRTAAGQLETLRAAVRATLRALLPTRWRR